MKTKRHVNVEGENRHKAPPLQKNRSNWPARAAGWPARDETPNWYPTQNAKSADHVHTSNTK